MLPGGIRFTFGSGERSEVSGDASGLGRNNFIGTVIRARGKEGRMNQFISILVIAGLG